VRPLIEIFIRTTSTLTSYVTCQINGDAGAILLYALILVVTEMKRALGGNQDALTVERRRQ